MGLGMAKVVGLPLSYHFSPTGPHTTSLPTHYHMTHDTHDKQGVVSIVSKFQVPSLYGLG